MPILLAKFALKTTIGNSGDYVKTIKEQIEKFAEYVKEINDEYNEGKGEGTWSAELYKEIVGIDEKEMEMVFASRFFATLHYIITGNFHTGGLFCYSQTTNSMMCTEMWNVK